MELKVMQGWLSAQHVRYWPKRPEYDAADEEDEVVVTGAAAVDCCASEEPCRVWNKIRTARRLFMVALSSHSILQSCMSSTLSLCDKEIRRSG